MIRTLFLMFTFGFLATAQSQTASAKKAPVVDYQTLKSSLVENKVYHGIVEVDSTGDRMMCMSILFKFDDTRERLDYYFKAWERDTTVDCDYTNPGPATILSTNKCIVETGKTLNTRLINLKNINKKETDKRFGYRILDIEQNGALSRCLSDSNGEPSKEAELLGILFEKRSIDGRPKVDTLNIKLNLFVNPPPFDNLNYIIEL
jgi:hypothetical protein